MRLSGVLLCVASKHRGSVAAEVVVACGHLTQWAVGTVGWLTAVRGLGGVIDVGTFGLGDRSHTVPRNSLASPPARNGNRPPRGAARLFKRAPPIRVNLIPSLVARVRRASGCLLFLVSRVNESSSSVCARE